MKKLNLSIETEQAVIDDYLSGLNYGKVSKIYKISTWKVGIILIKHNIRRRTNKELRKLYSCNSNYFDNIDSIDKAYFLGLLYADGWNDETNSNVGIQIKASDSKVLELLKDMIGYNGSIINIFRTKYNPNHSDLKRLVIKDEKLSKSLAEIGCVKNKTFLIKNIPEQVPENLISHFVRGYFDGDGSIHNDTTTNNLKLQIVGNKEFLEQLTSIFVTYCNVNNNKIYGKKITKLISFGGNIVCKRMYDWMYKDCGDFYMDRKQKIFLDKWKSYYQ